MSKSGLVRKLRRYAEQYRSGETLGRVIEDTEDLLEEAANRLDRYNKLRRDGRLVELPVKMGQTVYLPGGAKARVTSYYHCEDGFRNLWLTVEGDGKRRRQCIYSCDIGKDVFLTREEAVKATEKAGEQPNIAAQLNDSESICPICGETITYDGGMDRDDSGCTYPWSCEHCGATGEEGFDFVFDRHYNVRDKDGHPVPGRPE